MMKNDATSTSAQICVNKTVTHHSTYPDLFAGSHLLTVQILASECNYIMLFIGITMKRCAYYALCDVVGGLHTE